MWDVKFALHPMTHSFKCRTKYCITTCFYLALVSLQSCPFHDGKTNGMWIRMVLFLLNVSIPYTIKCMATSWIKFGYMCVCVCLYLCVCFVIRTCCLYKCTCDHFLYFFCFENASGAWRKSNAQQIVWVWAHFSGQICPVKVFCVQMICTGVL